MKSAEQRKQLSIEKLKSQNIAYINWLPTIETENEVQLKKPQEIAKRLVACMLCIQASFDQKNGDYDIEVVIFYQKLLNKFQIDNLTEKELIVFEQKGDENDWLNMTWKYESCWALLWALGFIGELKFPNEPMTADECNFAIGVVANNDDFDEFLSKIKMRSLDEILDQADLNYRYHWACVDARVNGKQTDLYESVVMERRAGLDWLFVVDADWDYPNMST